VDSQKLSPFLKKVRPDWIFHLASYGNYSWQNDVNEIIRTNVTLTARLLEAAAAAGCGSFVYAGSSSEYGFKDHPPREDEPVDPNSRYAAAKVAATALCRHSAETHGLNISTLRLYSVYGPYEHENRLIPRLCEHALRRTLPPLVSPDTARDFVYIDDAIEAFLLAAAHSHSEPGCVYNIGSGKQTIIREIVEVVRKEFSIDEAPRFGAMENRPRDSNCWIAAPARAHSTLGWCPRVELRDGLRRTAEWIANNRMGTAYGGK
jgi:dolichol-phosphate mannosyltransferase